MDAVEAIATAITAVFDADTGAGGLKNSTGSQFVRGGLFRDGHPQATRNHPWIVYRINTRSTPSEVRHLDATVAFDIYTKQDVFPTEQNAIAERLVTLFDNVLHGSLAASGWVFGYPVLLVPEIKTREDAVHNHIVGSVLYRFHVHKAVT